MLHAVGQTPTWPGGGGGGGGVGLSCDSPPTMMDWKSVAVSGADHRLELNRLIPTEPLGLLHPSTRWNLEHGSCVIPEGLCGDPGAAGPAVAPAPAHAAGLTGEVQGEDGGGLIHRGA